MIVEAFVHIGSSCHTKHGAFQAIAIRFLGTGDGVRKRQTENTPSAGKPLTIARIARLLAL